MRIETGLPTSKGRLRGNKRRIKINPFENAEIMQLKQKMNKKISVYYPHAKATVYADTIEKADLFMQKITGH